MSERTHDLEKRLVAEAAADLVEDGMRLGLGTGSTVAHFLPALARRELALTCVATSPQTARAARDLGFEVDSFEALAELDMAVDGADQVAPDAWLIKGGGAAHTREKVVAAAAARFVVVAASDKCVERLEPPVPLELLAFGVEATLHRLGSAERRSVEPTPDGNVVADYTGGVGNPAELARQLDATTGVVEHGLFPPELITDLLIARDGSVEHRRLGSAAPSHSA
jgi:ribose 5-phosphate isomerase A